jgi:hypothetical protein
MVNKKKIDSIFAQIDSYTDIDKLQAYIQATATEYAEKAAASVTSKIGLAIASAPEGAGAVATGAALTIKTATSEISDIAEKAMILAYLAQKIQALYQKEQQRLKKLKSLKK